MAKILLFEDDPNAIMLAEFAIEDAGHELIAKAESITKAQHVLRRLLLSEIEADVLLLDGNLDRNDRQKEFRFTPFSGGISEQQTSRKQAFSRQKPVESNEIVIPPDAGHWFGADARMVKRIMETCGIEIPIIGISGDSMEKSGVEVDYDLGKMFLDMHDPSVRLNNAIESVLNNQE